MKYIVIDNNCIDLTIFQKELFLLFVEIDDLGKIKREIGFDNSGEIIHAYPSNTYPYGKYGIFDLAYFDPQNIDNEISCKKFENKWNEIIK